MGSQIPGVEMSQEKYLANTGEELIGPEVKYFHL